MSVNIYDKTNDELKAIAGGTLYADAPVGSILSYGGTTAPNGWLLCQGQPISRTIYSELFAVIGTAFGAGDSSTTFNVPDLRETVPVGSGTRGNGVTTHDTYTVGQFKDDQLQNHTHNSTGSGSFTQKYTASAGDMGSGSILTLTGRWDSTASNPYTVTKKVTVDTSSGNPLDSRHGAVTRGKRLGVNYIIKAKQISIPTDFSSSMVGYLGKESNYNLYPWSHVKPNEGEDINQDITIERDGWYSIDYTLSNSSDMQNAFTLRDFDSQGDVHTIMRCVYDRSGTFRQTYLVPLKAGTYRYSHGGIGTLSVYMNCRDFA